MTFPAPIRASQGIEAELKAAASGGDVSTEVLMRLLKRTHEEDARLRREQDITAGALQHNARIRQMILVLTKEVEHERSQPVPAADVPAVLDAPPSQAEADVLAALEDHRQSGKCDHSEGLALGVDGICRKRALKGGTRCRQHQ